MLLDRILSTCFQASLLHDEGRPITFRLALAEPDSFDAREGPPAGLHRLVFDQGRPFDALNDMALDKRGGVYFTDTQGIYYLPPGGSVTKIIDEVPRPNGVVLSPDERTLYVHNKDGVYMLAFDVAPDGTISNRRNFARYKSVRIPGHADPSLDTDNGEIGRASCRERVCWIV